MKRASVVNVQEFIDEHPFGRFQLLVFFMCFVIVLLDGFDTAAIGFIAPSLLTERHLAKPDLAPVLSAALFGLAFGALVCGPLSDRVGRRSLMVASVFLFGVASVVSALSTNMAQLTVLRFMTGIGLGAAMANAVTMMDEFCPTGRRATVTSLMCCGFPLGAACGGSIAAWLVPHAGWRSVLMLGGVTPILHSILLMRKMPESVRFMVANGRPVARVCAILARISDEAVNARGFELTENAPVTGDNGL
ncbi:MFS transporter, partial [Paraburkholderia sediminicola]